MGEATKVNSDSASTTKHEDVPNTITPAAVGRHANQDDPRFTALVKRTLDLDDDDDDDIVNKSAKKAKRAHIADDDDTNIDPLKDATQDIESILVDTDGEDNEQNKENSFQDFQDVSQEQNVDDADGDNDDMSNAGN